MLTRCVNKLLCFSVNYLFKTFITLCIHVNFFPLEFIHDSYLITLLSFSVCIREPVVDSSDWRSLAVNNSGPRTKNCIMKKRFCQFFF